MSSQPPRARLTRTGPPKALGSGISSTPSLPWMATSQMYWPRASKLAMRLAVTPLASCIAAVVCVGVVATKVSPVRGPISIVRSSVRVEAKPATRWIGPSSVTMAVR